MKLSVIIPCFNEAQHITAVLDAVREVDIPKEIIMVDDGSTDGTAEILEEYKRESLIVMHSSVLNFGKGTAIRIGLRYVTGDIVIIQDADLEYDPKQYLKIIKPIVDGEADVVYGSRFLGQIRGMRLANRIANRVLAWTANILFRARITDEATCYKAFKAEVIKSLPLKCTGFEFCPEVTAKVCKRGIRIKEVPITYVARNTAEGKKIRWTDAFTAMWTLLKYRFKD
ncbi:MAG TPA: glycosyltransferase family 2 protein [Armatimonadota bacterium]|nr:glycosyltransferase family 2 protein [Armatimonadota bacterium]